MSKLKLHQEVREIINHFYKHYLPAVYIYDTRLFMSKKSVLDLIRMIKYSRYLNMVDVEAFLNSAGYVIESMGSENDKGWLVKFASIKYIPLI